MKATVVSYFDVMGKEWETDGSYHSKTRRKNKFIRGGLYRLKSRATIDSSIFPKKTTSERTFRLKGIVHQIGEMPFNGVIMKQESGTKTSLAFDLSPQQAKILHIKFEKGLEVFPMSTSFERIVERFPNNYTFNPEDLSTYPHCTNDGCIRSMLVRLDDLKYVPTKDKKDVKIVHKFNKKKYKIVYFNEALRIAGVDIKTDTIIKCKDNQPTNIDKKLTYWLVFLDNDPNVYYEIVFGQPIKGGFSEDGYIGVEPQSLKDKKFEDLFTIIDNREQK